MLGTALMIHPHSPDWRALGTVFAKTPQGSVVEVDRIGRPVFTTKEAAERYGLALCQAIIDEKLEKEHLRSKPRGRLRYATRIRIDLLITFLPENLGVVYCLSEASFSFKLSGDT